MLGRPADPVEQRVEQCGPKKLCGACCMVSTATSPSISRATGDESRFGACTGGIAPAG
ncbi:hypothetical protein [Mycobacterium genavense]|uniref:hypothetical protein n=1 Tax=Mycobacterium genavense TaxID=36812 RepID=UPI001B7FAF95|nr:hypothetical protein [Mycobacterium genavense]